MVTQSTRVSSHNPSYGSSILDRQEDLRTTTREFTIREESPLEQCETVIQWNWKTDQRTNRNHRCKHYRFQRCYVDVDKLIVWIGLLDHQLQNLRLSDSVLCVGKIRDYPIATWKSKIKWYSENNHFKDMNRIDGMPTELEGNIFPGITTLDLSRRFKV